MVYINTLMLQQVLAQPNWVDKLTPRDLRALTPLIWEHVNPYGRFELDMNARLPWHRGVVPTRSEARCHRRS